MQRYSFPDGTGIIGLPEGWRTNAQTCLHLVLVEGPADQRVSMNGCLNIITPNNSLAPMQNKMRPAIRLLVAPYCDPTDAIQYITPQLDRISRASGGPGVRIDKIIDHKPVKAHFPNGTAELISYYLTRQTPRGDISCRSVIVAESWRLQSARNAWCLSFNQITAPVDSWDQDLPLMVAITRSLKTNANAVQIAAQNEMGRNQQQFENSQRIYHQRQDAFNSYMAGIQNDNKIRQKSLDSWDRAVLRGTELATNPNTGKQEVVPFNTYINSTGKKMHFDPGVDPNNLPGSNQDWKRMQPVQGQ